MLQYLTECKLSTLSWGICSMFCDIIWHIRRGCAICLTFWSCILCCEHYTPNSTFCKMDCPLLAGTDSGQTCHTEDSQTIASTNAYCIARNQNCQKVRDCQQALHPIQQREYTFNAYHQCMACLPSLWLCIHKFVIT